MKPRLRSEKIKRALKMLGFGKSGPVDVTPAFVRREKLLNETARLNKLDMHSEYARNIAVTRSGRVSKPPLRRHLGECIRYDAYGRAIEVKFRQSTFDLQNFGGSSAGAEILGSLLHCQVHVDVAASSNKEKRTANESSVSEAIFQQTKKDRKIREKKAPPADAQVPQHALPKQKRRGPGRVAKVRRTTESFGEESGEIIHSTSRKTRARRRLYSPSADEYNGNTIDDGSNENQAGVADMPIASPPLPNRAANKPKGPKKSALVAANCLGVEAAPAVSGTGVAPQHRYSLRRMSVEDVSRFAKDATKFVGNEAEKRPETASSRQSEQIPPISTHSLRAVPRAKNKARVDSPAKSNIGAADEINDHDKVESTSMPQECDELTCSSPTAKKKVPVSRRTSPIKKPRRVAKKSAPAKFARKRKSKQPPNSTNKSTPEKRSQISADAKQNAKKRKTEAEKLQEEIVAKQKLAEDRKYWANDAVYNLKR